MRTSSLLSLLLVLAVSACLPEPPAPEEQTPDAADATADLHGDAAPDTPRDEQDAARDIGAPLSPCVPRDALLRHPRDVEQTVALINALPRPLTLPCFLESLARPIPVVASLGVISAQPAVGSRSPRVFLFLDAMILSIALEGDGSQLLEFGVLAPDSPRSLKAEIAFPLLDTLSSEAPYERIMYDERATTCSLCHAEELPHDTLPFPNAYTSVALRPVERELFSLERLRAERDACLPDEEPHRCALLHALFDHGELVQGAFPERVPTFYR